MRLEIIKRETPGTRERAIERIVSINLKTGYLSFNSRCTSDFGLSRETKVLIAKDGDSRNDWYLAIGTRLPGDGDRISLVEQGKKTSTYRGMHRTAAREILASVKAEKSASFIIAAKPVVQDGVEWYRIMTATPIRKI